MDVDASQTTGAGDIPVKRGRPMVMTDGVTAADVVESNSVRRVDSGTWVVGLDG